MFEKAESQPQPSEHGKSANLSFADVHAEAQAKPNQVKNDEPPRLEPVPTTAKELAERIVLDVSSVLSSPDQQKDLARLQQDAQAIMVKPEVPVFIDGEVTDANAKFRDDVSKAMPDALKYRSSNDSIEIDSRGRILAKGDDNYVLRNGREMLQTRQLSADAASPATVLDIGSPWAGPVKPAQLAEDIQKDVNTLLGSWAGQPDSDSKTVGADLIKNLNLLAPKINKEFEGRPFEGTAVDENADYRSAVRDELAKIESRPQFVPLPNITIDNNGNLESLAAPYVGAGENDHAKLLKAHPDSNPDMPSDRSNQPWIIDIGNPSK